MTRWPHFTTACRREVDSVLRSGRLTAYKANGGRLGPEEGSQVWRLEREIEKRFKVRHAVAVNSGTSALHAGLAALGVQGKEVVTSPFTFSGTVAAILQAGGSPRFADVDPHTFCITKEMVKRVITKRTAAILHVNLFGYFPDLGPLQSLGLPVIEDSCQAVGASRGGDGGGPLHQRYSGTVGLAGAYSFNGSKNLPSGEGGCLVTNDDETAERARLHVNHGECFGSERVGYNYRLTELHACIARYGLRALDDRNKHRAFLARTVFPHLPRWPQHVYYVTPFVVPRNRDKFVAACAKRGLQVAAGYVRPSLEKYKAYAKYAPRPLPVVTELSEKTFCLLSNLTPNENVASARRTKRILEEAADEAMFSLSEIKAYGSVQQETELLPGVSARKETVMAQGKP